MKYFTSLSFLFLVFGGDLIWAQTAATVPAAKPLQAIDLTKLPPPAGTQPQASSAASADRTRFVVENLSQRDPFKLPEYIIIKIRQKMALNLAPVYVEDSSIEAIRRWPLASYQLVGIIWDVKSPKALFQDRINTIHVLHVNDFVGNAKGVITGIQNGSVTVLEGKIPQVIKLKK